MITLEVRRRELVSPGFACVTLGGPGVRDLTAVGGDQAVRLFFPREGQSGLRMPTASSEAWMVQVMLMSRASRPWVRNMTVRRARPAAREIDIEFALHDGSPMTAWVRGVRPGDEAGIFDLGCRYRLPAHARGRLLVGDESALPAVLSILEHDRQPPPTEVHLEVATRADVRPVPAPANVRVHWHVRDETPPPRQDDRTGTQESPGPPRPGALVLEAVRGAELPEGPLYAWVAGESRLATGVRRHLVDARGVPGRDVCFTGYWRLGRSAPG
ncbi:siderophore-interacting protein [Streptomyces sp. NPDC091281]|uniref:siderophore-interacting protein n=1 Tax=Streptomyces sp. NPDC091281 TaxID=3365985 RepID=UPI0038243A18